MSSMSVRDKSGPFLLFFLEGIELAREVVPDVGLTLLRVFEEV
jgi:hypothetical protein